jgi:hypothetical protein
VTIQQIVKKIRERYACGWELSEQAAQEMVLDFLQKRIREELKQCGKSHDCKEAKP